MALVPVSFRIDGDVAYSRAFDIAAGMAQDLREPLHEVGQEVIQAVGRNFESQGTAESGSRWRPLTPAYSAWKQANYPGRPILVRTGEMRSAALSRSAVRVTPRSMTYTVDSDYAVHHQRGTSKMAKRTVVALSFQSRRSIDRIFAEWLHDLFNGPIWRQR